MVFEPRVVMGAVSLASSPCNDANRLDILSHLRLRYRAATSLIAALAVLALHALILVPALWGGAATHEVERFGAPHLLHAVLIDDRSASAMSRPTVSAPVLQAMGVNLRDMPARTVADPGLAALYGRYLGQIHARIDRAWLRPRAAIGADMFRCDVEIRQREDGAVDALTLRRCNGTARWQQSLVRGIEVASPLPAPPDPAVFAHRMVLHFRAVAYRSGEPVGNYEPERATAPDTEWSEIAAGVRSLRQAAKGPHGPSVIELRITGSHVEIEPQR